MPNNFLEDEEFNEFMSREVAPKPQLDPNYDLSWEEFLASRAGNQEPATIKITDPVTGKTATQTGGPASQVAYDQYAANKAGAVPEAYDYPNKLPDIPPGGKQYYEPGTYKDFLSDDYAGPLPEAKPGKMSFTPNSPILERADKNKQKTDERFQAAMKDAEFQKFVGRMGEASENIARAYSPYGTDRAFYADMVKDADSGVDAALKVSQIENSADTAANQMELQGLRGQQAMDLQDAKAVNDLEIAKLAAKGRSAGKTVEDEIRLQELKDKNALERAKVLAGARANLAQERTDIKANEKIDTQVERLGKAAGNSQDLLNHINLVENTLGFKLEDYDKNTGKVKGYDADVPGISLPLAGRVNFYSSDANALQSSMQKLFNMEIKDRSGAAVTTPEMERLKIEFATGKFNTEAQMIGAMKDYKKAAYSALKNIEARYPPEAKERYRSQGGMTVEDAEKLPVEVSGKNLKGPKVKKVGDKYYYKHSDGLWYENME